jgi:PrtD family type I secretion system ABC transporter
MGTANVLTCNEIERAMQLSRGPLALVMALSLGINVLALAMPLYLMHVYDHVLSPRSIDTLIMLTLIMFVILAFNSALEALRKELLLRLGAWIEDRVQPSLLVASIAAAQRHDPAAATLAWRDIASIRGFLTGGGVLTLFDAPCTPIFFLAMVAVHPMLGMLGICGAAVLLALALLHEEITRRPLALANGAAGGVQRRLDAMLRSADSVIAMGMLPGLAQLLSRDQGEARAANEIVNARSSWVQSVSRFFRALIQVLVMATATMLVMRNDASAAAIFACSLLLARAMTPVENAISTWRSLTAARGAYLRLKKLVGATPIVGQSMPLPAAAGEIALEQVSMFVPGNEAPALARVSLRLAAGEMLGVVGASGSGKSSLARAIAGTVRPSSGRIRIDGVEQALWLAGGQGRQVGFLPQEVEVFAGTLRRNIARLEEGEPEAIVAAARLAGLHELIVRLPRGYDTVVGEGGMPLSAGLRKRLGLARAFYGEPRLVVLDEPEASLDPDGEETMLRAIGRLKARGATIVVIAQRMGVIAQADKLLVMQRGAIDAFGGRDEILQRIKLGQTALRRRRPVAVPNPVATDPALPATEPGPTLKVVS